MSHLLTTSAASTTAPTRTRAACAERPDLFWNPLLEESPTAGRPAAERRRYEELRTAATEVCSSCPLVAQCLYAAVVDHDVAGIVAGTTLRERQAVRRRLGLVVDPEDFDTLAGVTARNRQVDHDEVLRVRRAHPDESLETIARRLGCSLSTVKRHLRRARSETSTLTPVSAPRPTITQVLQALVAVRGGAPVRRWIPVAA